MSIAMQLYSETQGTNQYDDIKRTGDLYGPIITEKRAGEKTYTFSDKSRFILCDRGYEKIVQVILF